MVARGFERLNSIKPTSREHAFRVYATIHGIVKPAHIRTRHDSVNELRKAKKFQGLIPEMPGKMPKNPEKCKQDPFCQVYENHVLPAYCAYYQWQSEQDAKQIKITAANKRQAMDSIAKADDLLWEAERAALAQKGVAEDGQRQATVDDQKCQVNPEQKSNSITVTIEDQSQEMDCMAKTLCEENGDAAAVSFSVIDSTSDGQEWLDIGVSEAQMDSWALELEDYISNTTAASSPAIDSTRDEQEWQSFLQTDEGLDSAIDYILNTVECPSIQY